MLLNSEYAVPVNVYELPTIVPVNVLDAPETKLETV
jgi:hypothetical protein